MTNNAFINLQAFMYVLRKVGLSFEIRLAKVSTYIARWNLPVTTFIINSDAIC